MAASRGRFHRARIVSREDAGGGLTRMIVEAGRDIISTYQWPGQYVEVLTEQQTGFFVLANEPGAGRWELLMRSGGGASDVLLRVGSSPSIEITEAIGNGFPLSAARGNPLIVALAGSGVAAGPPVVARRLFDGDAAHTHVLVGIRTPSELPMRGRLAAWIRSGVDVLACVSQEAQDLDDGSLDGIPYAQGRIQDVLRTRASVHRAPGSRIFVVGTATMVAALKLVAPALGITPEHIYLNY